MHAIFKLAIKNILFESNLKNYMDLTKTFNRSHSLGIW